MKYFICSTLLLASFAAPLAGQSPASSASAVPVTAEYYYRIKWGSHNEFKQLYERNHAPILREMQRLGFVTRIDVEEPYTHLAGGPRWDLRVTVTYRDADSAMFSGGFDKAFAEAAARLYPDKTKYDADEARRFSLLEDHWDMIVMPVAP